MAEVTEIAWTRSTFNAWVCSHVSPACARCYAEALDHRWGNDRWGHRKIPVVTSDSNWEKPFRWNREAQAAGIRWPVFCGSLMDVLDKNAPTAARERLWHLIRQTPWLDWQLLTKRAPNYRKYLPADWGDGYPNVWLGVTVEDIKHGLPRIDVLRQIPARLRFLSIEPLLEGLGTIDLRGIAWVIVGGESGPGARPMDLEWVRDIRRQCANAGVAFFFKQHGGFRSKGGCLLDGEEVKEWPVVAQPVVARTPFSI